VPAPALTSKRVCHLKAKDPIFNQKELSLVGYYDNGSTLTWLVVQRHHNYENLRQLAFSDWAQINNAGLNLSRRVVITLHQQTKNQKAVGGGLEPPTVRLATVQHLVVNPSRSEETNSAKRHYAAFIPYHHPRDRRARLPISTPYNEKALSCLLTRASHLPD
jgi:hypothetical protein